MLTTEAVAGSLDAIMGVKAVWGRSQEPVMCFGSRGDPQMQDARHFMQARLAAEKAITQPYLVTIGGGQHVPPDLDGRVLELVRVTGVYGNTEAFVRNPTLLERLRQWPVAVILLEVYAVEGEPLLVDDLGFPDRRILTNAYDGVRRDDLQVEQLWLALRERPVHRRQEIRLPQGFRDPGHVVLCGSRYPTPTATEGRRIRQESRKLERDPMLSRAVKDENRACNGGLIVCEACGFADDDYGLFDAHHLQPLFTGVRESRVDDFAVLCPTCHRWAHRKSGNAYEPLPIDELRVSRGISAR